MYKGFILILIISFLGGCGYIVPTPKERFATLKQLTNRGDLQRQIFTTKLFNIYSVHKDFSTCRDSIMDVYIEGDGLAWETSTKISTNPTPINPLGLKLFLQDSHKCSIYLARPCQYINSSTCRTKYWTSHRFSATVTESFNEVLNRIKSKYKISSFKLFGYSGGGAVGALLAVSRDDISTLITIAGNLDIRYWTKEHYLTPLNGSLNPADFTEKLSKIKQIHLIGGRDNIVGVKVFKSYLERFKDKSKIKYKVFDDFNHHRGWIKDWKKILKDLDEQTKYQF